MIGKLISNSEGKEKGKVFDIEIMDKDPFDTTCPICSHLRKHQTEKCLHVYQSLRTARCNHCGAGFKFVYEHEFRSGKAADLIHQDGLEPISGKVLKYWINRDISEDTLTATGVKQGFHLVMQKTGKFQNELCTAFVYSIKSKRMMIKYRDGHKNFSISKGSKLVFYGLDYIYKQKEAIIVEGEVDRLSYFEVGITNVVSVPNGVTISVQEIETFKQTGIINVTHPVNLTYLDDAWDEYFADKETIYIGTDNDAAGIKLRQELVRRIGKNRCRIIDYAKYAFPDRITGCKDANEVLVQLGPETLKKTVQDASEFPLEDIVTIQMIEDKLIDTYNHGSIRGLSTGFFTLDPHFSWVPGHPVVLNGYGGSGKTAFGLTLMMLTALIYDWKWGGYCPENYPVENVFAIMMEIFTGESFDLHAKRRMSMAQFTSAYDFISTHFFMVDNTKVDKAYTPKDLRDIARQLLEKKGINGFFTDPWNALVHNLNGKSLDQYLEEELSAEVRFATKNGIVKLVNVHPPTPIRQKDVAYRHPTKYEIRGGNIWNNKFYEMICIDIPPGQDYFSTKSDIYIQKVKDHKMVGVPTGEENPIKLEYVRKCRRFSEVWNGEVRDPFEDLKGFKQGTITFEEF